MGEQVTAPSISHVYFNNTWDGTIGYTVIDRDNNGILRPEEGDDVYEGEVDTAFPSLGRVPHQLWKDKPVDAIQKIIGDYREEKKGDVTVPQFLGFVALLLLAVIITKGGMHCFGLQMEEGGRSVYPPSAA